MDAATGKLISALKRKRQAEGYSLRKLSKIIGVSFSSLARMEREEGCPDHNSRIRILEWLGDDADALGLPFERIAHVHFRASKNIDSETIRYLLQVVTVLERKFGVRRKAATRLSHEPTPEISPVVLSKPEMESMAVGFRKELGLNSQEPVNPLRIKIEGVEILTVGEIEDIPPDVTAHLGGSGKDKWSAMSVPLDEEKDTWAIVRNEEHQFVRQHVSILEEFWHILLGHRLTKIARVADICGRTFEANEEHDAFYLAAATLIPENVIHETVQEKKDITQIAHSHGTSPELVEYRIKRLGLWREYKGKGVQLESP